MLEIVKAYAGVDYYYLDKAVCIAREDYQWPSEVKLFKQDGEYFDSNLQEVDVIEDRFWADLEGEVRGIRGIPVGNIFYKPGHEKIPSHMVGASWWRVAVLAEDGYVYTGNKKRWKYDAGMG